MSYEMTKIKAKRGKKVEIWWNDGGDEKYIGSHQAPRPELFSQMESLKLYVQAYLDIPDEWLIDIDITGVTMGYGEDGRMATVTALRTLSNKKVFVMNTPHDYVTGCMERFEDLEAEAKLYVEGKRAQRDLFDDDKKESPKPLGEDRQLPEMGSGTGWWELLECEHDASLDEIKKAFRIKAHRAHPDKPGNNAEDWGVLCEAFRQGCAMHGVVEKVEDLAGIGELPHCSQGEASYMVEFMIEDDPAEGNKWVVEDGIEVSEELGDVRKPLNAGVLPDGAYRIVDSTNYNQVVEYWIIEEGGEKSTQISNEEWDGLHTKNEEVIAS